MTESALPDQYGVHGLSHGIDAIKRQIWQHGDEACHGLHDAVDTA